MKNITVSILLSVFFLTTKGAPSDTSTSRVHYPVFYFGYGIGFNYFNMDAINPKVFGTGNKQSYFDDVQASGSLFVGLRVKSFYYGFGYDRGVDGNPPSLITYSQVSIHFGYDFHPERKVSFSALLSIGYTNFKLNAYPSANAISFDSLQRQSSTGAQASRGVSLISDDNLFIEPKIGIMFNRQNPSSFRHINTSIGIFVGYRYYGGVNWISSNGQPINEMPLKVTGVPNLTFLFVFHRTQRPYKSE